MGGQGHLLSTQGARARRASERRSTTDVAIVGAGPAGTAAAIVCAQAGLDVVIFERQSFPRDRPGETLHPGVEALLRQLVVLAPVSRTGFLRHGGIHVRWEGPARFVPYGADPSGPWRGYQAWRHDLDGILLARALEVGASLRQPCRALRPLVERGRVCGVETSTGRVEARLVVDDAGAQHWLARRRGIELVRHSPRLVARYGYCAATPGGRGSGRSLDVPPMDPRIAASGERQPIAPLLAADEDGWTWIAQVARSLYAWTRLPLHPGRTDSSEPRTRLEGTSGAGRSGAPTCHGGHWRNLPVRGTWPWATQLRCSTRPLPTES